MTAQAGILSTPTEYHIHIEYSTQNIGELDALKKLIRIEQEASEMRNCHVLFGFSARLWNSISTQLPTPAAYVPFTEIHGTQAIVPATQGDLWIWYQGDSHAVNLDAAINVDSVLAGIGLQKNAEVFGYVRYENRDFTGFIDGTENPIGEDAVQAALIPESNGSSFAMTQTWVHKLSEFNSLTLEQQEGVIGRTKADSVELSDDAMPATSHVSRTDAEVAGVKQKIVRRSVPYGNLDRRGLHFVAFSCDLARFQIQIERMFGVSEDNLHDRLTEFSVPISSSYWYVPSVESLQQLF